MDKLVSIAIATYNGEKYLEQQLDSIFSQTYKNIEVIVSDDKSTDTTQKILEKYKNTYGLKYEINLQQLGVTKNFEKAICLCKGEYIVLADQDDVWLPTKIETLVNEIQDYSMVYSNAGFINENNVVSDSTMKDKYYLYGFDSDQENFFQYVVLNSFILGCSVMFKKDLLEQALPLYQSTRNHDWWLVYCAQQQNGIKFVDEVLFNYRIHANNYSRSMKRINFFTQVSNFFATKRKEDRNKLYLKLNEILYILKYKLYNNKNEEVFLMEVQRYCRSYFSTFIHFETFLIAVKNQRYLFPEETILKRLSHLFSKLIGLKA